MASPDKTPQMHEVPIERIKELMAAEAEVVRLRQERDEKQRRLDNCHERLAEQVRRANESVTSVERLREALQGIADDPTDASWKARQALVVSPDKPPERGFRCSECGFLLKVDTATAPIPGPCVVCGNGEWTMVGVAVGGEQE